MARVTIMIPQRGEPAGWPLVCARSGERATKLLPRQVVASSNGASAAATSVLATILVSIITAPFGFLLGVRKGRTRSTITFKLPVTEQVVKQVVLRARVRVLLTLLTIVAVIGAIVGSLYLIKNNPSTDPFAGFDRWYLPAGLLTLALVVGFVGMRDPIPCRIGHNCIVIKVHPDFARALEERRAAAAGRAAAVTGTHGVGTAAGWGPGSAGMAPAPMAPAPMAPAPMAPAPMAPASMAPAPHLPPPPTPAGPPPGWAADPSGRFPQRWWDGSAWTADVVATDGTRRTDPPV